MLRSSPTRLALTAAIVISAGCSASVGSPTSPPERAAIVGVAPIGGAIGVAISTHVTLTFSHAMMAGMKAYVALHRDSLAGPAVAGSFAWSADRTRLSFIPEAPLQPHTTYVLHVGGGMMDATGAPVDYGRCPALGGEGVTGAMMGGGMMGGGEMGPGWKGSDGGFGTAFPFTTA